MVFYSYASSITIFFIVAKNNLPSCFFSATHYNRSCENCKGVFFMDKSRLEAFTGVKKASIHLRSLIDGEETHYDYIGEYRLKDGSHCIFNENCSINSSPTQKEGAEARQIAIDVGMTSKSEYCLTAESTPRGMPTRREPAIAVNATMIEIGTFCPSSSRTDNRET